jgi:hypothetical protein
MGGDITVRSVYGQGSVFTAVVPQTICGSHTVSALSPQTKTKGLRLTAPEARVLIVDDILINLEIARGLLDPWKMKIDLAPGGLEAVNLVRENATTLF